MMSCGGWWRGRKGAGAARGKEGGEFYHLTNNDYSHKHELCVSRVTQVHAGRVSVTQSDESRCDQLRALTGCAPPPPPRASVPDGGTQLWLVQCGPNPTPPLYPPLTSNRRRFALTASVWLGRGTDTCVRGEVPGRDAGSAAMSALPGTDSISSELDVAARVTVTVIVPVNVSDERRRFALAFVPPVGGGDPAAAQGRSRPAALCRAHMYDDCGGCDADGIASVFRREGAALALRRADL